MTIRQDGSKKRIKWQKPAIGLLFICDTPKPINSRMVSMDGSVVQGENNDVETTTSCAIENLSGSG